MAVRNADLGFSWVAGLLALRSGAPFPRAKSSAMTIEY